VRLHDRDDTALACRFARRPQHRLDLDGMVPVIVEDMHAVPGAGRRETALDAAKGRQSRLMPSASMPSSCATAIAAVALDTL
jgi:hypothetical protein